MTTTIAGPKVQTPGSVSDWLNIEQDARGQIVSISLTYEAAQFFHAVQQIVYAQSRSGPTASRPTNTLDGRYIGLPFFDTDLGLPVFLKTGSTSSVWVNAAGVPV